MLVGFFPASSLIVSDVDAIALPAYTTFFCLFDTINERLHALIVVGVWLHKIDDVEAVLSVFSSVLNTEVVPLRVAVCTIVIFEVQVVFCIRYLDSLAQVTTLESTLEYQRLILLFWLLQLVIWLQVLVVTVEARATLLHIQFTGFLARSQAFAAIARRLL